MTGNRRRSPFSAVCLVTAIVILTTSTSRFVSAELFTALVDLEKLLFTEGEVLKSLDEYIRIEEKRLEKLKEHVETCETVHQIAIQDSEKFLSNPVNAFLLIKRLSSDWKSLQKVLTEENGKALLRNITEDRVDLMFPEDEDLSGAATALTRLQDTYQLETASLARGEIQGVRYAAELKASDCFELGRQSYHSGDHHHTVLWMQEAMDRYANEVNKTVDKAEILEYLAFSTFMQDNVRHALKLTHDLLEIDPDHPRARGNIKHYEDAIAQTHRQKRGDDGDVPIETSFKEQLSTAAGATTTSGTGTASSPEETPEREIYERLCRGEKMIKKKAEAELKCRYVTNGSPYLLVQPMKQEEAFKKPLIVIYHGVMFDSEIETIKEIATPRLKRATVQNYKSGELETANYRISKSAWLKSEDYGVVNRVSKRIGAITGLEMATAEDLQVVNYGIGGHYEPHYDFARREERNAFKNLGTGNRIATFLFYMSDVSAGGATVFPQLGIALWPRKGSAAFWFNLHRSGDGDMLTRHAACPVLAGSKWVSNKWFHERGQEFLRKCGSHRSA